MKKTAVITGATGTLGKYIASGFMERGINVVIQYNRSVEKAEELLASADTFGVKAAMFKMDLERPEESAGLFDLAQSFTGNVDFLINSASLYTATNLNSVTMQDILKAVSINAAAPLILSRNFKERCSNGAVVNILDARMVDYDKEHVAYSLSKQMLFSLTRMMSVEFAPGIRVNGVAPGIITIPEGTDEKIIKKMENAALLKKKGEPADILSAVMYLLESDYITGETIFVDGGRNLKGRMYGL